ncbi:MFS transporter [Herbaspirillum rubrisubalbicans]|uniref:MFS transporter n=1 Tax=Herbaspirillum rubrisubalbicans TaxID=80842 RepID=UPI001559B51B|nr:MFS transporter [Herbaspirillum rubrisubalbicans]
MTPDHQAATRHPLSYPLYRTIWICILAANISVWMQNVAAAWLMTSLTRSPLMVALIQTATTLPAFLFCLPAGVLADQVDRRRLLIICHSAMLCTSALLSVLVRFDLVSPPLLLLATFMLGTGSLLSIPVGQASTSDVVPRAVLLPAIALNGVAYNAARAVGPALAGLAIARFGSSAVFLATSLLFGAIVAIYAVHYRPPARHLPEPEDMLGAIRSALRYVQHAPVLRDNIYRTMLFIICASGLWALLPLVTKERFGADPSAYGLLLASMGGGAVIAGIFLGQLRARVTIGSMAAGAPVVFALAMLGAAWIEHLLSLCAALLAGGAAWVTFTSITNAAFQTSLPSWVRARALAIMLLTFQGSMALGAIAWGTLAGAIGVPSTLTMAAALAVAGLGLLRNRPLRMGEEDEVTPGMQVGEPVVVAGLMPSDGPLAVQVSYLVVPEQRESFSRQAHRLGIARRRNGASAWHLYRDIANPDHYIERFLFASWAEYLRQQQRATVSDHGAEAGLLQFLQAGERPCTTYFITEPYPPAA